MEPNISAYSRAWESALRSVDKIAARTAAQEAIAAMGIQQFGDLIVSPTLEAIGSGWEEQQLSLAEVYMAGRISTELLAEYLPPGPAPQNSKIAIAMLDDRHALGKNLVLTSLQVAHIPVRDFGTMGVQALSTKVQQENIELLLISTLMLRSALRVKQLTESLKAAECGTQVIVGGAPFRLDPALWQKVGADAMGSNAASAVKMVKAWMAEHL